MEVDLNDALVVIGDLELVRRRLTARVEQLESLLADPVAMRAHLEQVEYVQVAETETDDSKNVVDFAQDAGRTSAT